MLYRYARLQGVDVTAAGDLSAYTDSSSVSPFAQDAVSWAVSNGLLKGNAGVLNPQGSASRAELAALMVRASALLTADAE